MRFALPAKAWIAMSLRPSLLTIRFVIARARGPLQSRRPCDVLQRLGKLNRCVDCHAELPSNP